MFILVGLGNPGDDYEGTRHNTGRMVLEAFRKTHGFPGWKADKKLKALISSGKIGKQKALLLEPETFMNKSGEALKNLQPTTYNLQRKNKNKEIPNLVVIHDDLDIPFGSYKISFNKSSGGHKGVESLIKTVKTEAFVRVRIGICPHSSFPKGGAKGGGFKLKKPQGEAAVEALILGKYTPAELATLKKLSKRIAEGLVCLITEGREKAMSQFN